MTDTAPAHEPLHPVIMNKDNEALIGLSPKPGQRTLQHEDSVFDGSNHSGECPGCVKRIIISSTHAAIHCSHCGLRVSIPQALKTYRDLRAYFPEFNYPATASVRSYSETAPPSRTQQENADGELTPHRHISTKEEDTVYDSSHPPSAYER